MSTGARTYPYSAFNFQVDWGQAGVTSTLGGFSDVSGLTTEMHVSEYRVGNEAMNHVRKVPGLYKAGDVTLKRGVVNSMDFYNWIAQVRVQGPDAQKKVVITLFDEGQNPVQKWTLYNAIPMKYTGPTLAAGKGDVAMEEIVLAVENFEISPANA